MKSIRITTEQNFSDRINPVMHDTVFKVIEIEHKRDMIIPGRTLLGAYYYRGIPYVIKDFTISRGGIYYRLASDEASALQMRRIKAVLGLIQLPHQLSRSEMDVKVSEILARIIADNIDQLLTGGAS